MKTQSQENAASSTQISSSQYSTMPQCLLGARNLKLFINKELVLCITKPSLRGRGTLRCEFPLYEET